MRMRFHNVGENLGRRVVRIMAESEAMGQRLYSDDKGKLLGSTTSTECKHPFQNATHIGDCGAGCCDDYLCGDCQKVFRIEAFD